MFLAVGRCEEVKLDITQCLTTIEAHSSSCALLRNGSLNPVIVMRFVGKVIRDQTSALVSSL